MILNQPSQNQTNFTLRQIKSKQNINIIIEPKLNETKQNRKQKKKNFKILMKQKPTLLHLLRNVNKGAYT